jgi:hypothetical protein
MFGYFISRIALCAGIDPRTFCTVFHFAFNKKCYLLRAFVVWLQIALFYGYSSKAEVLTYVNI